MKLINPCKNCIVQPMCKDICDRREEHTETYNMIQRPMSWPLMIFALISLTCWVMDYTETLLYRIHAWVYIGYSISYVFINWKHSRTIKYNRNRFTGGRHTNG